jgi:hypothetical protein
MRSLATKAKQPKPTNTTTKQESNQSQVSKNFRKEDKNTETNTGCKQTNEETKKHTAKQTNSKRQVNTSLLVV